MPSATAGDGLLQRFAQLPSGREKPGRFWRIDLENLAVPEQAAAYTEPVIEAPAIRGGFALDLRTAKERHSEIFARAFGAAVPHNDKKFAALAAASWNTGALVYVPAGVSVDDPIRIVYNATNGALYPVTLVVLEEGARCTVVTEIEGSDGAFVCGIDEVVAAENAQHVFASVQSLPEDATAIFTRGAKPGRSASVSFDAAQLGAHLSVDTLDVNVDEPGAEGTINVLFFPRGTQHVDVVSTVAHNAGDSQSQTLVKSAATGNGQARYLGNIRIAPHAQHTESALRDDALLLSKGAHIDSVPALEIAANDVKAYHGATVGALDEEQIFYMTSRGISRDDAERMIALGFFEPVVERFPTEALRERIRETLAAKAAQ
ncbi:MAG TPA: Fe-S cluster assembly protein SufD [Candidatus Baltobacteraceae bacterium]|nr:Fe-S cluster assembly protein SufD [Candidatus Baltobacteraceae bacterium]